MIRLFLVEGRFGAEKDTEKGLLLVGRDTLGVEMGTVEPLVGMGLGPY